MFSPNFPEVNILCGEHINFDGVACSVAQTEKDLPLDEHPLLREVEHSHWVAARVLGLSFQ